MSFETSSVPTIALRDSGVIPQLGFGTFQIPPEETVEAVLHALQEGRLVQHVAGVVAAQCELAEHDEVGLLAGGLPRGGHHAGHVALEVADGEVELGDGEGG